MLKISLRIIGIVAIAYVLYWVIAAVIGIGYLVGVSYAAR